MDFIQSANKQVDKFGAGKHGFSAGNPSGGIPATFLSPTWCDNIQQEIVNVIEGAGIAINPGSQTQLFQAIQAIYAGASGNDYKASVRAATVGSNVTLAGGAPNTLDGVTLVANDRILVKDQTTGSQNGLYYVSTLGTGANGTWTRSTDADAAGELTSGAVVAVEEGTQNADSQWMLTTDGAITIGTTALAFARKDASSVGGAVQGSFKNLQASATGLSASVSVTADEIAVEDSGNLYRTLRNVSLTIAGTSSGVANGLDTGALAVSTWYSVWVIWNGATAAGLLSLSATAPTMPSGYTHKARVGWIRTDGTANKYPLSFKQAGRRVQYVVAATSNIPAPATIASGAATYPAAVSVSNAVPPTASAIHVALLAAASQTAYMSPNAAYGSVASCPIGAQAGTGGPVNFSGWFNLESTNVYWGSSGSGQLNVNGWEDNL